MVNKEFLDLVIQDDVISLYRNKFLCENEDITQSQSESFEIIVNETGENVGLIGYRYNSDPNYIDYGGNINYRINPECRRNGYAKRALTLMLEILKKNTKYDQPLFVASTITNTNYLKVAADCGGKLIHRGKVPNNVIDGFYDEDMKYVEVYQFDIEKVRDIQK